MYALWTSRIRDRNFIYGTERTSNRDLRMSGTRRTVQRGSTLATVRSMFNFSILRRSYRWTNLAHKGTHEPSPSHAY